MTPGAYYGTSSNKFCDTRDKKEMERTERKGETNKETEQYIHASTVQAQHHDFSPPAIEQNQFVIDQAYRLASEPQVGVV